MDLLEDVRNGNSLFWGLAPFPRVQANGRRSLVDDTDAPQAWILADRAGNKVCIATWPDGAVPPDR